MLEKGRDKLLDWLLPAIGAALAGIALSLEEHLAKLIPTQPELWAVRAIALSLVLFGLLLGSLFWFRPKLKPLYGVLWDDKDNVYCSSCKVILAPTNFDKEQWGHFINRSSFQCPKCQAMYLLKDENDRLISKQTCIEKIHEKLP